MFENVVGKARSALQGLGTWGWGLDRFAQLGAKMPLRGGGWWLVAGGRAQRAV